MTELSAYQFSTLHDGTFTLSRGLADGLDPILLVAPAGECPYRESLQHIERELAPGAELGRLPREHPCRSIIDATTSSGGRRRASRAIAFQFTLPSRTVPRGGEQEASP